MKIVLYGHPTLRQKSEKVDVVDDNVRETLDEMVALMRKANGVGLAANQVDIAKRFFVLEHDGVVKKVINPEILEFSDEIADMEEGCLSIPGVFKKVNRPAKIKVKYLNENGEEVVEELEEMWSRAFQHEFDHIEGILFTDKLSAFKKQLIKSKLNNIMKGKVKVDYRMKFLNAK